MSAPSQLSPNHYPHAASFLGRRRFLQQTLAMSGAALLTGCASSGAAPLGTVPAGQPNAATSAPGRLLPGADPDRVLVIVDLLGGNDGLSTVVPAGNALYHDLRPTLALEDVLDLDGDVGLHPALQRLHRRGVATVEGVGPVKGDLSHFAMTTRWEQGDVDGSGQQRTGFLGRLCDSVDDSSTLVGVSMAGATPHFVNNSAATLALDDLNALWFLEPNDWNEAEGYQRAVTRFASSGPVSDGYERLLALAVDLQAIEERETDWDQPMLAEGGDLGRQLFTASELIINGLGPRVVYANLGGFDTHADHQWQHPYLMEQLDVAVDGFLERIEQAGLGDKVVVATISEFGRRVASNNAGLDHGAASSMLVCGAIAPGRYGEPSPLDQASDLDEDGNLVTTVGFDRYLGALAEGWLGIEADSVLASLSDGAPLELPFTQV